MSEERSKDIKAATIRQAKLNNLEIAKIATTGEDADGKQVSASDYAAAVQRITETGSFEERRKTLEFLASNKQTETGKTLEMTAELRNEAVQRAIKRGDSNIYGAGFGNEIVAEHKVIIDADGNEKTVGKINSADDLIKETVKNAASGKITAEHTVQNGASAEYLVEHIVASGDDKALANFRKAADSARLQTSTAKDISDQIDKAFQKAGSSAPKVG